MTREESEEQERKLRLLAKRLHEGFEQTHGITEQELQIVRQAAGEAWEQRFRAQQQRAQENAQETEQTALQQTEEEQKQEEEERLRKQKEDSNEHGHGYSH